jgi:hypothetical protein
VCLKKQSLGQTSDQRAVEHTFVIVQYLVDRRHDELSHLGAHSMLHLQSDTALSVVDHPLKERDVKVEEFTELVNCN